MTDRSIGSYLGLIPTKYTSESLARAGIDDKTDSGHARRLLVEAAWHHASPIRPEATLRCRWGAASSGARDPATSKPTSAYMAGWCHFDAHKKRSVIANATIARALAGWRGSLTLLDAT